MRFERKHGDDALIEIFSHQRVEYLSSEMCSTLFSFSWVRLHCCELT